MYSLNSIKSYQNIMNTISQLPKLDNPALSQVPGAYMASKYSGSINKSLTSSLNSMISGLRSDALQTTKNAKALTNDPKTLSIKTESNSAIGTLSEDYKYKSNTLQIDQLATKQVNQGNLFDSKAQNGFNVGEQNLTISSGTKSYQLNFAVKPNESNASVLNRAAKAINDLNSGVQARVTSDNSGKQQLVLESSKTGTQSAFSVSGDFANALGVNKTSQNAQNAKFTFNDQSYETQENDVSLDTKKVQLQLKKTTDSAEKLNTSANVSGLAEKVSAFVESYNKLQNTLEQSSSKATQAINSQLDKITQLASKDLSSFGISRKSNGQLEVDKEALSQNIENNPERARQIFVDRGSLTEKIQTRTDNLLKIPANALMNDNKSNNANPYQFLVEKQNNVFKSAFYAGNLFDLTL